MPVEVKLNRQGREAGKVRAVTTVTLDYERAQDLPDMLRFGRERETWERVGGVGSLNYRVYTPSPVVDVEDKVIDK